MDTKEIVAGFLGNDVKVIRFIYKHNFNNVRKLVLNNNGTTADAWDVFQESMMFLYEKLRKEPDFIRTNFHALLFSICKYGWYKKMRVNIKHESQLTFDYDSEHMSPFEFQELVEQMDALTKKEQREKVFQEGYLKLKLDCQQIIEMVINGFSIEEIADIMKYSNIKYAFRKRQHCKDTLMENIREQLN